MGNMQAESAMRANNAQDGMTGMGDEEYTAAVDNGTYGNFANDGVGYGLCQWTFPARKAALLAYAQARGYSIGDAGMQVDFAIKELKNEYAALWRYLCVTEDVYEAASRVCVDYERPAVNNIAVRAAAANKYYARFSGLDVEMEENGGASGTPPPTKTGDGEALDPTAVPQTAEGYWPPRVLCAGMYGPDVAVIKALLSARGIGYDCDVDIDGKFDDGLRGMVTNFQASCELSADGIVGKQTWGALLAR